MTGVQTCALPIFLPALAARNTGSSLNSIAAWAVFFGLSGNVAGFFLAVLLDQPLGPILVLTAGTITLCSYFWKERQT